MKCQICATEMTCVFLDWYCPKGCLPDDFDPKHWLKVGAKLALTTHGFSELMKCADVSAMGIKPGVIVTIKTLPGSDGVFRCEFDNPDEIDMYGDEDPHFEVNTSMLHPAFELVAMPPEKEKTVSKPDAKRYRLIVDQKTLWWQTLTVDNDQFSAADPQKGDLFDLISAEERGGESYAIFFVRHVKSGNEFHFHGYMSSNQSGSDGKNSFEDMFEAVETEEPPPKAGHWFQTGAVFTLTDEGARQMNFDYKRPNGNLWGKGDYGIVLKTPGKDGSLGLIRMDIEPANKYNVIADTAIIDDCFKEE